MQIIITKRLIKQTIIGTIYLALFASIVFLIAIAIPKKPNQPSKKLIRPEIAFSELIPSSENLGDILVQIKNSNLRWGAPKIKYQILAYNKEGEIIDSREGESFILPHQTKYIFNLNWNHYKEIKTLKVKIVSLVWKKFIKNYQNWLEIHNLRAKLSVPPEEGYIYADGTVTNNSPFDLKTLTIKVILRDKNGKIIGINKTVAYNVLANEDRYFKVVWNKPLPGISAKNIDFFNIEVYPEANFMLYQ